MTNFEKYEFDLDAAAKAFTTRCRTKDCHIMCLQLESILGEKVVRECLKKWLQQEVEDNDEKAN